MSLAIVVLLDWLIDNRDRIERCLVSLLDNTSKGTVDLPIPFGPVESGQQTGFTSSELGNGFVQQLQTSDAGIGKFGPPDDVFMSVIDAYFTYCQNQPYSFFHEDNFRERLSKQDVPRHLVLAMMAAAVRFCSHTYYTGRALEMSVEYANKSWKLIVSDCFTVGKEAEVSAVQTVALLGLFDFTGTTKPQ